MIALAVALAGCGDSGAKQATPTTLPTTTAPSPTAPPPPASEITLAFAGDVHFIDETLPHLADPETAFGPYADLLRSADFAMINLETAVTERGEKGPKRFHFRAPPAAYAAVKAAGVDLVSIANNHTLDYGEIGLTDTLDFAKSAGMPVVGAGRNATEAYEPYIADVKGIRVAVVALSQVWELAAQWKATATKPGIAMAFDRTLSVNAVKKARAMADIVVVYLHWGTEDVNCANNDQKSIAKALAQAGAHILVGTHSHVPHGDGYLEKTYVHYGLGNFLWARSGSKDTLLLNLTVRRDGTIAGKDLVLGVVAENGQPTPITGDAAAAMQRRLDEAAKCTGLAKAPA